MIKPPVLLSGTTTRHRVEVEREMHTSVSFLLLLSKCLECVEALGSVVMARRRLLFGSDVSGERSWSLAA